MKFENTVSLEAQMVKNLFAIQETQIGKIPWRTGSQPTSVFLPEESHGQRSVVGYSPRGRQESDKTERLHFTIKCLRLSRQVHQQVAQGSATCLEVLTLRQGKVISKQDVISSSPGRDRCTVDGK